MGIFLLRRYFVFLLSPTKCFSRLDYISNKTNVLLETGIAYPLRAPVYRWVHVAHLSFICFSFVSEFLIAFSVFSNVYFIIFQRDNMNSAITQNIQTDTYLTRFKLSFLICFYKQSGVIDHIDKPICYQPVTRWHRGHCDVIKVDLGDFGEVCFAGIRPQPHLGSTIQTSLAANSLKKCKRCM